MSPFSGFDDWDDCMQTMTEEEGHDEQSAENICGALQAEAKADNGDPDALLDAIEQGAGLVADVGVDLVSGVDVPAVDSKWVMLKDGGGRKGHDYRVNSPILVDKADGGEDRRLSYAAAMIPREPDKEGDVVPTATVEKAAHDFLKSDGGIDTDHSLIEGEGDPVESWVLKEERTFNLPGGGTETYGAGTWMLGIEWGAEAWERIKSGELTGLSIYGMADHVELKSADCGCGPTAAATAKGFEVPFADEVVVHVVYESQTAAEKASEEMGLGGDIHEHEFDGMTVFMPGATHDEFVDAYNDEACETERAAKQDDPCWEGYTMVGLDENGDPRCVPDDDVPDVDFDQSYTPAETRELSAAKSQNGDTLNRESAKSAGMGDETTTDDADGDGPTLGEVAASVDDLADTVASMKEAVETEKQDAQEAAAMLGDEMGMAPGVVMDILEAAQGSDPEDVLDAIASAGEEMDAETDEDEEDDEMESSEKRVDDANLSKGGDSQATAQTGVAEDGTGGSAGVPSYAAAAESYEGDQA
jgi:hypothetical protein